MLGATLKAGETRATMRWAQTATAYLVPAQGAVEVNGVRVDARDGAAISGEAVLTHHRAGRRRDRAGRRGLNRRLSPHPSETQGRPHMTKVLVLYYSAYGHIEKMAQAVAEGAREAGRQRRHQARARNSCPRRVAKAAHFKLDQAAPVATIDDLADYDAIIVGVGTRFGRMASQMASFLDQAGGLWARGALNGKVGAAFTSTATQHGGQETTLFSIITNLLHFGMVIVGLPYSLHGPDDAWTRSPAAPLWRHHHRRRRRLAPAQRHRTGRSPLPGPQDRRDRHQAARLIAWARGVFPARLGRWIHAMSRP